MNIPTPYHSILTGRMLFLKPKQQCTKGKINYTELNEIAYTGNNNNNDRLTAFDPGQPG